MVNNNDERILYLREQIKKKEEKLGKSSRFTPITNCSIEIDGVRHNIQVLDHERLELLLVKLNMYRLSAKDLKRQECFKISGFKLDEWMTDIQSRLDILNRANEVKAMKTMEDKLSKLLSDRKKVELEIDEIESMLKED